MNLFRKFWQDSRRGERAFFITAGFLIAFLGGWLWQGRRVSETLPPLFEDVPASHVDAKEKPAQTGFILVHVAGAVKKAGVLSLPPNRRVLDAIHAAGGVTVGAAVDALNLAAPLEDGQKIVVPTREQLRAQRAAEAEALTAGDGRAVRHSASTKVLPARPINVNTATAAELEQLPGIGPAFAARIITYRKQKGRIQSLDDLDQVKGMGPKKLEKLRQWVRF
jgi:competence protein ComEA